MRNPVIELAVAAPLATAPEEPLLTMPIDLTRLGINQTTPDQRLRLLSLRLQECLPDGRHNDVPVQLELVSREQNQGVLTWLAPPSPARSRRFVLAVEEPGSAWPLPFPRVQVLPDVDERVWITDDGRELLSYCYSPRFPKPFFFPVIGPRGRPVTRLGHPCDFAGGHDHQRSLWVEHMDVNGVSFETEHLRFFQESDSPIIGIGRQIHRGFLEQEDGPVFAALTMHIDWVSHTNEILLKELRHVRVYPLADGEQLIDLVLAFRPRVERVTFGKTSYGILAVRVARSMGVTRGGGRICNARGGANEAELHLQPAEWCDYSGPVMANHWDGIAIFDHPDNIHHPPAWHVRDDGWMCVAPFFRAPVTLAGDQTLTLRYRIFVHGGDDSVRIAARYAEFVHPPAVILSSHGKDGEPRN